MLFSTQPMPSQSFAILGGRENGFRTPQRLILKRLLGVGKPSSRPSKITKLCEGIGNLIDNIVTKFQIDPRSDGAWARTKVRFCHLYAYSV